MDTVITESQAVDIVYEFLNEIHREDKDIKVLEEL